MIRLQDDIVNFSFKYIVMIENMTWILLLFFLLISFLVTSLQMKNFIKKSHGHFMTYILIHSTEKEKYINIYEKTHMFKKKMILNNMLFTR